MKKKIRFWVFSHMLILCISIIPVILQAQVFYMAQNHSNDNEVDRQNSSSPSVLTLKSVLSQIEMKFGIHFTYNEKTLEGRSIQNVDLSEDDLEKLLNKLFNSQGLKYKRYNKQDNTYFIYLKKEKALRIEENQQSSKRYKDAEPLLAIKSEEDNPSTPQSTSEPQSEKAEFSIKGTVIDDKGEKLIGVSVILKGTTIGSTTDVNGVYTLSLPGSRGVLVYSYIGYIPEEVEINGRSVIDVTLLPDIKSLSEVVVVGYGTQQKKDITSAIASMNAEQLKERPLARVDQALVGQMAGVRVRQTSGVPGKGFSIQVRGTGSISANNEPLYVIDGFPLEVSAQNANGDFANGNPLNNINPNDIESIQVLKDASAAAIYGSRGSNGVVVITTKKGQSGKAKINFNVYGGWNETAKKLDMLSADEWADRAIEMINGAWVNSGPGRTASQTTAERKAIYGSFNNNLMIDERWLEPGHPGLTYIDWQDQIFRKGKVQDYQLSATGGNDFVKYYVSGDYLDQQGIAIGVGYKRYSARANVEIKANDKLKFGVNISPSYSIASDPGVEGKDQQLHLAVAMVPISEDSVGLDVNIGNNPQYAWGSSRNSPLRVIQNSVGDTKIFRTISTIFAEYNILKDLAFKTTFNLDNSDASTKTYRPAFVSGNLGSRQASGQQTGYKKQTFVNENTLAFNKTIASQHDVSVIAGIAYNFTKFDSYQIRSANGFTSDVISTLNAAASISAPNTWTKETQNILLSYFSRLQYSFKNRYLLSASIRRDGSSRFGNDTKFGVFPSASVGWRISEENFMRSLYTINDLKVRASWGIAGNNGIGSDYGSIPLLASAPYTFGGTSFAGQVPTNAANPNLSWEESETIDVGFDLGLFKNRIFTSFDYYTKTNRNLLLNIPVATASGVTTQLTNIGRVLNKGWEVEVSTKNLTGALQWTSSINFSHNTNKVMQLGPNNAPILTGGDFDIPHSILKVGLPINSIYVVRQNGILTQADIDNGAALYGTEKEGDPKYEDQVTVDTDGDGIPDSKDGVITPDDRVIVGHPNPDYIWGINNTLSFKGFDLSFLFQGQWGGKIYSLFGRAIDRTGQGYQDNALGFYRDRWRSPEDPGDGKRGKVYSTFGRIKNTDWLYANDYWRLRTITLGYNLGKLVKNKIIQGARVYATAENFFGGNKYYGGFNPEAVNTNGDDYGAFPLAKSMIFGLNLTF